MTTAPSSSTFQQLVAIPLDQYNQMLSMMNMRQPIGQKVTRIQNALSNPTIAAAEYDDSAGDSNPYDHMMRQGMMLEELRRAREQLKTGLSAATPKPYRNRALALYNQIAPLIQFNDKGELLLTNNSSDKSAAASPVVGSRAEDLIQHAVRDRRKHFTPTGWSEFADQLHKHNIPRMMLNHATIEELQARASPSAVLRTKSTASSSSTTPVSSPSKLAVKKEPMLGSPTREGKRVKKRKRSSDDGGASASVKTSPFKTLSGRRKRVPSKRYPRSAFLTHFKTPSTSGSDFGF